MNSDTYARGSGKRINAFGIIVIVVILVPVVIALWAPPAGPDLSDQSRAQIEVNELLLLTNRYILEQTDGELPSTFLLENLTLGDEPYIFDKDDLVDPWGTPYVIVVPGSASNAFDVMSAGPDGTINTEDDITSDQRLSS